MTVLELIEALTADTGDLLMIRSNGGKDTGEKVAVTYSGHLSDGMTHTFYDRDIESALALAFNDLHGA